MRCHLSFLVSTAQILVARSPRLDDATRTLTAFALLHNSRLLSSLSVGKLNSTHWIDTVSLMGNNTEICA